jgi:predicted benzoate:H+ symporter BenE
LACASEPSGTRVAAAPRLAVLVGVNQGNFVDSRCHVHLHVVERGALTESGSRSETLGRARRAGTIGLGRSCQTRPPHKNTAGAPGKVLMMAKRGYYSATLAVGVGLVVAALVTDDAWPAVVGAAWIFGALIGLVYAAVGTVDLSTWGPSRSVVQRWRERRSGHQT